MTPSKISGILGLSPYTDQYSTYHYMAGHIDIPETDEMRRGTYHEAAVLREFYHRHPELKRIRGCNRTFLVNAWFGVTPDSMATDRDVSTGRRVLVEAKTTAWWDEWGEAGTDEVPEHYFSQVIAAAHGMKADEIRVFVLGPFWEYREYVIQPDPELAEQVLAKCYPFWLAVQNGDEPELCATKASYETWVKVADPDVGEGQVEIDRDLARRFLVAAAAEKQVKACKAELVNALGNAKQAVYDGKVVAQKQRNSTGGISIFAGRNPPVITDTPTIDSWETT